MEQRVRRSPGCGLGVMAMVVMTGILYAVWLARGAPGGQPTVPAPTLTRWEPTAAQALPATANSTETATPTSVPETDPAPPPIRVGVVAGHWQSDSGAVCDDGLQEVTINLDIAARVVAILQYEGYAAELLPEFSDRLTGYQAAAFVSIHTDACNVPNASGFKVARVLGSAIPEEEDRLVACLIDQYAQTTGLPYHRNSITYDMTAYHAFSEIDPQTPAAIIELGFMGTDRALLTERSYDVALGVARGIVCFLEGE